jgi:SMC interacting uncharacterized protein involved in chromosome segregation
MGVELLGILASIATVVSGLGWVLDRNSKRFEILQKANSEVMSGFSQKMEQLDKTLVDVRLTLPEKYVTKEELMTHIRGEERWHESVDRRLNDIHEQMTALREWRHR